MAGNNATKSVITELAKRLPLNQKAQFKAFMNLNAKYNERVNKYPEKLPTIDWDYYRANVRTEAIKMVDEFEKKYEELNKIFDDRPKLDTKKYYDELEKQRAVVQAQVQQYIAESNERIKAYEAEIKRLCTMKPYSQMTMEEFINLRPELSDYIPYGRKPLFWPHDPEEQKPGPVGILKADDDGKGGGGGDGSDDSGGGGGGGQAVKPADVASKTEKFEFNPGEAKEVPNAAGVKATAAPQPAEAKTPATPPPQVERKVATPNDKVAEPQIHIYKPASAEERRKLDPCNLMERQEQKVEAKSDKAATCIKSTPKAENAEPKASAQPTEAKAAEMKPVEKNTEPTQKKPHPCDLVKNVSEKKEAVETVAKCTDAPKGLYKNEKGDACVFVDPCKSKFSAGIKSDPKEVERTPSKEKVKTLESTTKETKEAKEPTKAAKEPTKGTKEPPKEPKKPSPCDSIKTTKTEAEKDICTGTTNYKDEKTGACTYTNPCKTDFGKGTKGGHTEKTTGGETKSKSESKCSKEPKKSAKPGEEAKKAKPSSLCKKTEPKEQPKKSTKSGDEVKKPKIETKPSSSSCQKAEPREAPKKSTKPAEGVKKLNVESAVTKDKHSCTMVFAEPQAKDEAKKNEKAKQNEKKSDADACASTPYYNPFRSEEENKRKEKEEEEEGCDDSDPCSDEQRSTKKDYYNPCKGKKE